MIRLSSNLTLFFKIFIPIFFIIFYGLLSLFFLFGDESPLARSKWFPYSNLIFYAAALFILYKTVWQLYRIDCTSDHFIVTNYKSAFKYTYDSIDTFKMTDLFFFTVGSVSFKSNSSFGKRIRFLVDKNSLKKINKEFNQVLSEAGGH